MKKYFTEKFFKDENLGEDIKFNLANRMYQFFKFFELKMNSKIQLFQNFMKK